jgi:phage gp29-like protein
MKNRFTNFFSRMPEKEVIKKSGATVVEMPPSRTRKDLAAWNKAIKTAEMPGYWNRAALYNIYLEQLDIDGHLLGILRKRTAKVLSYELQFIRNGEPDEKTTEWLESDKFKDLLSDLQETQYWGFSLFEFYNENGWFNYSLIPRKHVNPYNRNVIKHEQDSTGMSYVPFIEAGTIAEAGEVTDLGLLKTATYYSIAKRNAMADWFSYAEEAGRNFKTVVYKGGDIHTAMQVEEALKNLGSGGVLRMPDGIDTDIKSGASSSQNQLFENLIKTLNAEQSKLILGQTMTTDDGSSRSQADVHEGQQAIIEQTDRSFVLNWLNYTFIDYLKLWGINAEGGRFAFIETLDVEAEIEKDLKLKALGYTFTPEQIAEKYGIE